MASAMITLPECWVMRNWPSGRVEMEGNVEESDVEGGVECSVGRRLPDCASIGDGAGAVAVAVAVAGNGSPGARGLVSIWVRSCAVCCRLSGFVALKGTSVFAWCAIKCGGKAFMTRRAISGVKLWSPFQSSIVLPARKCAARWSVRASQEGSVASQKPQREMTISLATFHSSRRGRVVSPWTSRRCWTRWSLRRKERGAERAS